MHFPAPSCGRWAFNEKDFRLAGSPFLFKGWLNAPSLSQGSDMWFFDRRGIPPVRVGWFPLSAGGCPPVNQKESRTMTLVLIACIITGYAISRPVVRTLGV